MKRLVFKWGVNLIFIMVGCSVAMGQIADSPSGLVLSDEIKPFVIGSYQVAPVLAVTVQPSLMADSSRFFVMGLEAGLSFIKGDESYRPGDTMFSGKYDFYYVAPFITGQLNIGGFKDSIDVASELRAEDFYQPFQTTVGVMAGSGGFIGLGGVLAVSTDYENVFMRYGLGIDMAQLFFGVGFYQNLSKNGDHYKMRQSGFLDIRYMFWES